VPPRSGRNRPPRYFIGWFTTNEAAPIAATPVSAARRPVGPPNTASAPAARNRGLEKFAKRDNSRSGRSSAGADVPATAA